MAVAYGLFVAAALVGCVGFSIGDPQGGGGGGGGGESGNGSEASSSARDAGAHGGEDCIVEPTTGQTLCSGVKACGSFRVDHDVYPNCGFRPPGPGATSLQLECACNGALCPVGIASSCEQAARLLAAQSEALVCVQLAEGRCTE